MIAKICVAVLAVLVAATSVQNAEYFAKGYYTHFLPMMAICGVAWFILFEDGPPSARNLLLLLAGTVALSVGLELDFGIYKRHPFDENGVVTLLSVCQLLVIGFTSFTIWKERNGDGPIQWKSKTLIWLIMAVGFLFLAIDEKALIHEGLDRSLHKIMGMQETTWTSRIDDFLIGVYGIIGMTTLYFYSEEMLKFRRCMYYLAVGFVGLFTVVAADALSSRLDFFTWMVGKESAIMARDITGGIEEVGKLMAEACFLTGFSTALSDVRSDRIEQ